MCWERLKAEFCKKNFLLDYDRPSDFAEPVCRGRSLLFVLYRIAVSLYVLAILIYGLYLHGSGLLVTFTYWSFIVLCCTSVLQAATATYHYVQTGNTKAAESEPASMSVVHCVEWVGCNIVMVCAPLLCVVYWSLLFEGGTVTIDNATVHGANAIYALLDRLFTALPVRLLHFWHVMLYGVIYGIMTGIHYAAGGAPIYPMLDYYNAPGMAVAFLVGLVFVVSPIIHFLMFLLTLAREYVRESCSCCKGKSVGSNGENKAVSNGDVELGRDNPALEPDAEKSQ